jgi:diguanylate cyclase (GGDEF)-like protein/PAS domain S-box-containing protein
MNKLVVAPFKRKWWLRILKEGGGVHTLLPLFTFAVLVLIGISTFHVISGERAAAAAAAQAATAELADAFEVHVQRNLGTIDRALKTLKYSVGLNGQTLALRALNQQGLTPSGLLFTVSIINGAGIVVASNSGQENADVSSEPFFKYHRQFGNKQTYVSQVQRGTSKGEWIVSFSRRLADTNGQFSGAVVVAVDPGYLTNFQHHRIGKSGALGVFGTDRVLRALLINEKLSWGQLGPTAESATPEQQPWLSSWDEERRYTSLRPISGVPLTAMVALSEREQMAAFALRRRNLLWLAGGVSATLVFIVALICAWSVQVSRTRRRARRAEETYAAASKASMDAFFVLRGIRDARGTIVEFNIEEVNVQAERLLGANREALTGRKLTEVLPDLRRSDIFDELVAVTLDGGATEAEWQWQDNQRAPRWLHRQVVGVENGAVAIVRDITRRRLTEEHIRYIAHHDELTGLANRVLVRDRLDQALRQAKRRARHVALVFIDLDGFKQVNDTLGHDGGDALLKVVAARMAECVRSEDTVGRFGGDEFVIILADQGDDPRVLEPLLEKIRVAVSAPVTLLGSEVRVGCSMGVAIHPTHAAEPGDLMRHADAAMYQAKQSGKNNFRFYSPEDDTISCPA